MQGAQVQSLVRELDLPATTKTQCGQINMSKTIPWEEEMYSCFSQIPVLFETSAR